MSNQKISISNPNEKNEVTIKISGVATNEHAKVVFRKLASFGEVSNVILDFSECTQIDSTGLGAMLEMKGLILKKHPAAKPRVVGCNNQICNVLKTVGFDKFFDINS
jgi:anti-anti-sigma regulatory factor